MVTIERTDPVTGEKTVQVTTTENFFSTVRMPEREHKRAYLAAYGKARKEGKNDQDAKLDAREVVRQMYLEEMKPKTIEEKVELNRPYSFAERIFQLAFIVFGIASLIVAAAVLIGFFIRLVKWVAG